MMINLDEKQRASGIFDAFDRHQENSAVGVISQGRRGLKSTSRTLEVPYLKIWIDFGANH